MPVVTPLPLTEDVQIFNEICELVHDAIYSAAPQPRLRQLEWRLTRLARQQPGNFLVRTTLATTLLLTGQRERAAPELEIAYRLRTPQLMSVHDSLIYSFITIGQFTTALALAREMISEPQLTDHSSAISKASFTAFLAGDVGFLSELDKLSQSASFQNIAGQIIAFLGANRLVHFPKHQQIVQSVLQPYPCWFTANFVDDGYDPPMISVHYAVSCSKQERRALDRRLVRSLYDYYSTTEIPPGYGVAGCCPQLFEIIEETPSEAMA